MNPPVFYQWRFNDEDIPGETGSSLTLTNVVPADSGIYTMVATNPAGTATSDPAELVKGLDGYSEKGAEYGETLMSIIRFNKFTDYDLP